MNIIDDWHLYPILTRDGRLGWSEQGYRWIPNWAARPLMRAWNRLVCRLRGHFWTPFMDANDCIHCAHCPARRPATYEDLAVRALLVAKVAT